MDFNALGSMKRNCIKVYEHKNISNLFLETNLCRNSDRKFDKDDEANNAQIILVKQNNSIIVYTRRRYWIYILFKTNICTDVKQSGCDDGIEEL